MKCPLVSIKREPQECIENKCYFLEIGNNKCSWMSIKKKKEFAKKAIILRIRMVHVNLYITVKILFVKSINQIR